MFAIDVLGKYIENLGKNNTDDVYSMLMFALQIPSICGRIEYPQAVENTECKNGLDKSESPALYRKNGKLLDGNIYKHWVKSHAYLFEPMLNDRLFIEDFADALYTLRCNLTHEGIVKSSNVNVILLNTEDVHIIGLNAGGIFILSISFLCETLFSAAYSIFDRHDVSFSDFRTCGLDTETYWSLSGDVSDLYHDFWKKYSKRDWFLVSLYSGLLAKNLSKDIEEYFVEYPDSYYVIENFERKYTFYLDWNNYEDLFYRREHKYSYDKSYIELVCGFTYTDFEQMKCVYNALVIHSRFVNDMVFEKYHIGQPYNTSLSVYKET